MSVTITDGTETITPALIHGYRAQRTSRNIVHDTIGGGIGVTIGRPRPRSGTLRLLFDSHADAFAALELHARPARFELATPDRPALGMTYVVGPGRLEVILDEQTGRWALEVEFQEIET